MRNQTVLALTLLLAQMFLFVDGHSQSVGAPASPGSTQASATNASTDSCFGANGEIDVGCVRSKAVRRGPDYSSVQEYSATDPLALKYAALERHADVIRATIEYEVQNDEGWARDGGGELKILLQGIAVAEAEQDELIRIGKICHRPDPRSLVTPAISGTTAGAHDALLLDKLKMHLAAGAMEAALYKTWKLTNAPDADIRIKGALIENGLTDSSATAAARRLESLRARPSVKAGIAGTMVAIVALELISRQDDHIQTPQQLYETDGCVPFGGKIPEADKARNRTAIIQISFALLAGFVAAFLYLWLRRRKVLQ